MARIFICYCREDTSGHAGRLRDALSARFGSREIFRDIETIAPGEDFVQAMTRAIHSCRVEQASPGSTESFRAAAWRSTHETVNTVILRIAHDRETADVPIDPEGRTGPTAALDREARLAGRSTVDVPIDRVRATLHFGELIITVRSASVRPAAHGARCRIQVKSGETTREMPLRLRLPRIR
jgi:hypothetical protein